MIVVVVQRPSLQLKVAVENLRNKLHVVVLINLAGNRK